MKAIDPENCEWYTPQEILVRVYAVFEGRVDVDPCCNPGDPVVRARTYYRQEDDGLKQEWKGRVYMNPPYGREIGAWTGKLISEYYRYQRTTDAIALLPVKTDTKWWESLLTISPCWCEIRGRIKFVSPTGKRDTGTFASAAVLLSRYLDIMRVFEEEFQSMGMIWGWIP